MDSRTYTSEGTLFNPSLNNKVSQSSSSNLSHRSTSSILSHRSTSSQSVEHQQRHTSQRTIGASQERDPRSKPEKGSFDIFRTTNVGSVMLKPPLHVLNKEKKRDSERFKNAPEPQYLRSGMVLLKNFISNAVQVKVLNKCRELGIGSGGFYRPGYRNGRKLHLQMMCLGKDWDPDSKSYNDSRLFDDAVPPEIPEEFKKLVDSALHTAHNFLRRSSKSVEEIPNMSPDVCIVNFYDNSGKLGLHQDIDESKESLVKELPIVSLSVGDSAEFLYGDVRDADKAEKVILESGDVLIFGGKSRLIFHGVASVKPNTAPTFLTNETAVRPGRLNLTFRQGSLFNPSLNNKVSQSSSTSSILSHRSTSSQSVERQQRHTSQRTIGASQERDPRSKPEKGSFDIFRTTNVGSVMLKPPLHVLNKEKKRDSERFKNAPEPQYLRSGMVLLKNFISNTVQVKILNKCRELGIGSGGFYRPGYRNGTKLHLQMMCLGKDWDPDSKSYNVSRLFDDAVPPEIPEEFKKLVDSALHTAHNFLRRSSKSVEKIPNMSPDVCIVNFYDNSGKLGLHQDIDESKESLVKGLPVVSLSIGDSAEFLYGDVRDADKAEKVILESGDVLIFGGKSRLIFHGVSSVKPNTAPTFLTNVTTVRPGRLNLTFRQV